MNHTTNKATGLLRRGGGGGGGGRRRSRRRLAQGEDADAVAAGRLGGVQGQIGGLEQVGGFLEGGSRLQRRHPDAYGNGQRDPVAALDGPGGDELAERLGRRRGGLAGGA